MIDPIFLHRESQNKQEELRKRENALRDLRERHINLQNKFEHKSRLQSSYNDLQSTIQALDSEIKELEKSLNPLAEKIKQVINEKENNLKENSGRETKLHEELLKYTRSVDRVKSLIKDMGNRLTEEEKTKEILELENQLAITKSNLELKKKEIKKFSRTIGRNAKNVSQ